MIGAIAPYLTRIRRRFVILQSNPHDLREFCSYQSNDIVDRLNYQYTAMLLSFAAITMAATQYVGKPIQCWVPPEFTGAWEKCVFWGFWVEIGQREDSFFYIIRLLRIMKKN